MEFTDEQIEGFIQLYQKEYNIHLEKNDAVEKLYKLKELFSVVLRDEA